MSDWNSSQYMKFGRERTQPSADLINRLGGITPARVLDLGCGPGNSTAALAERFTDSKILGIDYSEDMLSRARETHPELEFVRCSVPDELDRIDGEFDLIFSNACIHWISGQAALLKALFGKLSSGGTLAVQIPLIQHALFYRLLDELVADGRWQRLSEVHNFHNLLPEEYYDLLGELSSGFAIWEMTYYHTVQSPDGVIEWYKGSGLRPYLDLLDSGEKEDFLADLRSTVAANFPARKNGSVILKMPRLFFTAVK